MNNTPTLGKVLAVSYKINALPISYPVIPPLDIYQKIKIKNVYLQNLLHKNAIESLLISGKNWKFKFHQEENGQILVHSYSRILLSSKKYWYAQ